MYFVVEQYSDCLQNIQILYMTKKLKDEMFLFFDSVLHSDTFF